jgi:diguanylate cyclase (GGDEF)-like protein
MSIIKNEKKTCVILSIAGLLIFSFLIIHFLWMLSFNPQLYFSFLFGALLTFVILIMLSWKAFGPAGGIAFCILSCFVALSVSIGSKYPGFNLLILLYIFISIGIYIFLRKEKDVMQINQVTFEELEESFNSLTAENQKHSLQTEALHKKYFRYLNLKGVVELLSSSLSLSEIVRIVVNKTLELVGKSDFCLFYLIDEEKQKLALAAFETRKDLSSKIKSKNGDIFDNWILKQRQPLMVNDTRKDYRFGSRGFIEGERNFRSLISSPLITEEKVIGVLRLDSSYPNAYLQDDLRLLNIIANLASVSVENAMLFQRTVELAITDGLTGLHVYRYFMERFSEELHRAARTKSHLSLLMCDIDDFKKYNDVYGHAAGDIVLKNAAQIITECTQAGDFIARYGGEEFALFLPKQNKPAAVEVAEKIRKAIKDKEFILRRKKSKITISIGIATFPEDGVIAETIIKEADLALYKAKQEGKDRVCSA